MSLRVFLIFKTWLDAQCTPKRVSVVSRFLASIAPHLYPKPCFREHLKLKPMESTCANFLTTDKMMRMKLDHSIKLIKCHTNY